MPINFRDRGTSATRFDIVSGGAKHGTLWEEILSVVRKHGKGPSGHAGDMPNFTMPKDGQLKHEVVNAAISLEKGKPNSVFQAGGTSIVIHQGKDDYKTDPDGNAGDRIACGVIEPGGSSAVAPPKKVAESESKTTTIRYSLVPFATLNFQGFARDHAAGWFAHRMSRDEVFFIRRRLFACGCAEMPTPSTVT